MNTNSLYHSIKPFYTLPSTSQNLGERCFVIPGQGSAYPGMFEQYLTTHSDFQNIFKIADQSAAFHDLLPISTYLLSPHSLPKNKIHIYRNCALFCVEVAIGQALINNGIVPHSITGHSFGECAGIVLSGLISFEEMLAVVIYRNLLCPPANELGSMITLSSDLDKLETLINQDGVYLANINSQRQHVISVSIEKKDFAIEWLRKNRVPHLLLHELPQPYHSPLMEPYRKELKDRLNKLPLTILNPTYPFFSGIMHYWINRENYLKVDFIDLLSKQFTEPVDFIQQIESAYEIGARRFYEVGPGKMLEPSIKNILQKKTILYRGMEESFPLMFETKQKVKNGANPNSKWFKKIKEIIQSVTGYTDKDIQIENSFQNDLGIDSLRKAEILVRLIKEQGLNTNSDFSITRFSFIHEAVEYLENYSEISDPLRIEHEAKIEALAPCWTLAPIVNFEGIQPNNTEIFEYSLPEFNWKLVSDICKETPLANKKVIFVLIKEDDGPINHFLPQEIKSGFQEFSNEINHASLSIILVDKNSHTHLLPFAALLRSLSKETKKFVVGYISNPDKSITSQDMAKSIHFSHLKDVKFSDGLRYVKELMPISTESENKKLKVLAIGGTKGIGFELLNRFPEDSMSSLLLVGRTSPNDETIKKNIESLQAHWPLFKYIQIDATNIKDILPLMKEFFDSEIDVVLNSAGSEVSENFNEREEQSIRQEIKSKIDPFLSIEKLKELIQINRVFHFTSVVSQFGNKGQAIYSWNNSWMEQNLSPNSYAIAWAPWESVGMTSNEGLLQKIKEWGISLISPDTGSKILQDLIHAITLPQIIVPMDRKDTLLFGVELYNSSILGSLSNNFEAVFFKEINLKEESFLSGHVLLGHRLVPAAYFLSQLLSLSKAQFGRLVSIQNFNIENALIIEDDYCSYKIQCFHRPPYDLSVYSIIPHAHGNFSPDTTLEPLSLKWSSDERSVDIKSFYDDDGFGESFHFIKKAFVDGNNQLRVEVDSLKMSRLSKDHSFDFWLTLLDMAFQSLTMQLKVTENRAVIPLKIGELIFSKNINISTTFSFFPRIKANGKADIFFANNDGSVFCAMKDVTFKTHYYKDFSLLKLADTL